MWDALQLPPPAGWHERLLQCYAEPQRHYHTAQHLRECLDEFDGARSLASHAPAVELAIWFHDAVYDPRAQDNEERSAALAEECLCSVGASEETRQWVADLILATKHHLAATTDQALLIDVDLAILGQPPDRYGEYEAQIQREYAWVPTDVFAGKRAEVLQRFLDRPRVYATESFFDRYEARARENLTRSLKRLHQRK